MQLYRLWQDPKKATIAKRPCLISASLRLLICSDAALPVVARPKGSNKPPGYIRFSESNSPFLYSSAPPTAINSIIHSWLIENGSAKFKYLAPSSSILPADAQETPVADSAMIMPRVANIAHRPCINSHSLKRWIPNTSEYG